ncbi:CRP-like cAMP-binding protein [Dyadobacter sp. BE34]|uniref:CRP-like cAMP-binding protein n=1 Tax=Dyadobacter fermentans TaxID=94254 RepID=A0ABU1QUM7_9BACT|nr:MULTISPECIES: Crp/Fnr family transcriptional regulator [Dyadobacter]MDR6804868.1 CRP-like cAMP-binding protein [Dyadobacter fermentans]MDR7043373.1 CRP-like cAMP-binding protein [Dyadobacter sp. BE242]MDR7197685.1 CRP-like cAMP-binding protein [Dyadobacter sp. BE34]MDR7214882.1 CRP-like cAMP-binding protein [Dyadobacter sp. BE31]MDR7262417.1 CRP-like cAMP-binding protein [Dyadobacter sp. BE32]
MQSQLILQNLAESIRLDPVETDFFLSLLQGQKLRRREYLLQAGEVCRYQSFVVSGCLKVSYLDPAGSEHVVKFAPENWWAFDLESFALQSGAFYSIQATEDTEVLKVSRANMDLLLDRVPQFEKFNRLMYQTAYIALQRRVTQNLASKADERYQQFQAKYPGLQNRIAQKDIASYLGVTPEFLSSMRRREMLMHF